MSIEKNFFIMSGNFLDLCFRIATDKKSLQSNNVVKLSKNRILCNYPLPEGLLCPTFINLTRV